METVRYLGHFLSFPEHNTKSIQHISTNFATNIKHVALIFHLIFSVENELNVVIGKVIIYGNDFEDI